MLVLGLDAEKADAHARDGARPAQEAPPAKRQDAPVHLREHLVDVGDGDRHPDDLAGVEFLGDEEPVLVEHELELDREVVEVLLAVGNEVPVVGPGGVVDLGERVEFLAQTQPAHRPHADPMLGFGFFG